MASEKDKLAMEEFEDGDDDGVSLNLKIPQANIM